MNMRAVIILVCAALALPVVLSVRPVQAQENKEQEKKEDKEQQERYMYQWTDGNGVVHMSDRLEQVPVKYRKNTQTITMPEPENSAATTVMPERTPSRFEAEQEDKQDAWKQRYQEWKERLKEAQKRCDALEQKRTKLNAPWGTTAAAPEQMRVEIDQTDKDLQSARAELEEARTMVNKVLPDEARKAGVPPGWLRE